ncbi:MAG TPA: hypothetical protein VJ785_00630 [Anaerolineales bacterium]|nr:hypothetical protein [Anaerolineales bacterium]
MSTPALTPDETVGTGTTYNADMNESIRSRLPRGDVSNPPPEQPPSPPPASVPDPQPVESSRARWGAGCLPAFWTIASLISMTVNVVLLAVILSLLPFRGAVRETASDQVTGLLGGLYHNFVKMDQATITRTIPVDANIPLNIVVPVQATTRITLAEDTVIPNARVFIRTGGLTLDSSAIVTLPANTQLAVSLDFPLTVQNTIPVHLEVPVSIPLNETQLHEPFVGLQQVVEPWYCMVEPDAMVNGTQVCSTISNPPPTGTTTP